MLVPLIIVTVVYVAVL